MTIALKLKQTKQWFSGAILLLVIAPSSASAMIIFDIFGESGDNLGFIEFSNGGILTNTADVLDFDYTQAFGGVSFDESHLTALNVLVDPGNGTLCWGDWGVAGTTVLNNPNGCGMLPDGDIPRGLSGLNGPNGVFFDNFGFQIGTPNQVSDGGDDDEDLDFVMRPMAVPLPGTLALLSLALLALLARKRLQRKT